MSEEMPLEENSATDIVDKKKRCHNWLSTNLVVDYELVTSPRVFLAVERS